MRVRYMHSDIDTIERIEIIRDLRLGAFDVLVGINLLARRPRHSRMRAGGDPRRRQGRFFALRDFVGADDRPRGEKYRRAGDALRRRRHRVDAARDGRDQPPPRQTAGLQRSQRHHAGVDQARHPGHYVARSTSGDHVTVDSGLAAGAATIGHNFQATIADLEKRMKEAAGNLEFEDSRAPARRNPPPASRRPRRRRRPARAPGRRRSLRRRLLPASANTAAPPTPRRRRARINRPTRIWGRTIGAAARRGRRAARGGGEGRRPAFRHFERPSLRSSRGRARWR